MSLSDVFRALLKPVFRSMRRAVIVWVPSYDPNPSPLERLLDGMEFPWGAKRYFEKGPNVNRDRVIRNLRDTEGYERVKIFLGHGTQDALLGPGEGQETDILSNNGTFSAIYDKGLVNTNPSAMFAFCCDSGVELGPDFCNNSPERSFLGYKTRIYVPLFDKDCQAVWRRIIRGITSEIIRDGAVDARHEHRLKELYATCLSDYIVTHGKRDPDVALLMAMYLNSQRENVCHHPQAHPTLETVSAIDAATGDQQ